MADSARRSLRIGVALLVLLAGTAPAAAAPPGTELLWSTYLGGTLDEAEPSLDLDAQGQAHVAATTASSDFPVVLGPEAWPEEDPDFTLDIALVRLAPGGTLLWSGYLGDQHRNETHEDIAVGSDGYVRLTGWTGPYDEEVLVSRFGPGLLFTDLFLGEGLDMGQAVAVSPQGTSYVTGYSNSYWFPTIEPNLGEAGPFVLKLDPAMGYEEVFFLPRELGVPSAIALDGAGNIYVTGRAPGWHQGSVEDVWVVKLDPSGAVLWDARLGGSEEEASKAIAVDAAGRVWVAGWTESADFPVHGGRPYAGGRDAFLARLTPTGVLAASTLLGGTGLDEAGDLALDGQGVPYLAGSTASADFPLALPLAAGCGGTCGGTNAFVTVLDPSTLSLTLSTLLGGAGEDGAYGVAVDPAGTSLWVAGLTSSPDFPTLDAWQPELAGGRDLFVTALLLNRSPDCSAAFADPASLWPPNGRMVPVTLRAVADPDGDPVTIAVTGISQDEPLSRKGQPDATGLGTSQPSIRADRAGKGDGRVYHITFEATDPAGAACAGTVTVCVPHDRGKRSHCVDGGARFDSSGTGR